MSVFDEGPSLKTSSFCLFISGGNITTQHSYFSIWQPAFLQASKMCMISNLVMHAGKTSDLFVSRMVR